MALANSGIGTGAATAFLVSGEEVPPVAALTTGTFPALSNPAGTAWFWWLDVAEADRVTMAHIHQGAIGTNGPVVVQLVPDNQQTSMLANPLTQATVTFSGVITPGLLKGPLAGKAISDLTALLKSGNAYINVHSVPYPEGVSRGQVALLSA
ncbi:hypothetical protein N2152v2_003971 [Parachlorella kessleri]